MEQCCIESANILLYLCHHGTFQVVESLIKDYLATRKEPKPSSKTSKATPAKQPAQTKQPAQISLSKPKPPPSKITSNITSSTPATFSNKPETRPFSVIIDLCEKIRAEPSYNAKSIIVANYFKNNPGNLDETYIVLKQLIPSIDKRVFNVKDKQVDSIKQLLSRIRRYK